MFKALGFGQAAPDIITTDEIIPLHWFEDGYMWKKIIVYTLLVFPDALDAEKLHSALDSLVARPGYRKLGGRLRKSKNGKVEYHVPSEFTASRPAVAFTHTHHDMLSKDHATASKIPTPTKLGHPSIVGNPEDLSDLVRVGNKPLSLDDYLTTDRAILGLHVITFRDKTCVTLSWPHIAFDAMGKKAIIEGWTLMLQGRESEIPTPIGYDTDPLATFGNEAKETHILASKRMGMSGMTTYVFRNIFGLAGAQEIRMVCVPASFWQKMYSSVCSELESEAAAEGKEKPFVTEGDVLTAWWTRLCAFHLGKTSATTIAAQNAMSLRKVLQGDLLPPDQPFISMALGFPTVLLPAKDVLSRPLSWLALQFRHAINSQGTRAQVESYAQLQREFSPIMRMPLFFGDSGMYNLFFSNWQKAGLFSFDFSAAAVEKREKALHAEYIQCVQDPAFPEGYPISGKDQEGNYWVSGFRPKGLWGKMEGELERQIKEGWN